MFLNTKCNSKGRYDRSSPVHIDQYHCSNLGTFYKDYMTVQKKKKKNEVIVNITVNFFLLLRKGKFF